MRYSFEVFHCIFFIRLNYGLGLISNITLPNKNNEKQIHIFLFIDKIKNPIFLFFYYIKTIVLFLQ